LFFKPDYAQGILMHTAPKPPLNNHEQTEERSRFREVVVAGLRARQLLRGSKPRIEADPKKRKNTSIAMEEVRRGLITFTQLALSQVQQSITSKDAGVPIPITASEHVAFSSFNVGEEP
jgi:DNA-directed RNA polymerase omega subunit